MLREIKGLANEPGANRRWFRDDDFDLFVWQTEGGDISMFQLCYGVDSGEQALVWHQRAGLFRDGTGHGWEFGGATRLGAQPDDHPVVDPITVKVRFEAAVQTLPRTIRHAVSNPIREYLEGRLSAVNRRRQFRREVWQCPLPP